ncbi:LCP family protein [Candidatus Stoquefichus sp. SB1]|uniref:LCP family protein n=1 Tax=Candidatus Stoquefichus sp. SB1 TaxID=1658109 RepID=UPI00067E6814|nr:LCP family protein [Candidatus Stoquefichus sp. SB1]
MSKKKNIIQKITQWKVILGIQLLVSLVLIGFILKLGVLPMLYMIILIVLLLLVCLGTFLLMRPSKVKEQAKIRVIIGKVISLLVSLFLLIASLYIAKGDSTLGTITGANEQTTRISVITLKDSNYKKLSDLKDKTVEVNMTGEADKMKEAVTALQKEESSIKTKEVNEYETMATDLYSKKTSAIYVNEAYFAVLEANHENFENDIDIIWTYEIIEKTQDISKEVSVTKDPFIVYISGIDTYGKVSTVSRTDVNMLVTVNPTTKQILMTSIPRDYYVTLANKGKKDKLTHSGLGGIENTVKTVENFMNVEINYYARVNFTSLIKMVDALGGIDVESDRAFTAFDGSTFKKGINHLNGDKALVFSRERHAFADGDNERVFHQQLVLTAMIKKMMSPTIITNYSSILNSINGSFETNMKSSDITSLLQMQISDMASWEIAQKQLSGSGKVMTGGAYMPNNNLYYMIPNDSSVVENKAAIQSILKGQPIE